MCADGHGELRTLQCKRLPHTDLRFSISAKGYGTGPALTVTRQSSRRRTSTSLFRLTQYHGVLEEEEMAEVALKQKMPLPGVAVREQLRALDDAAVVTSFLGGEERAFQELVERYQTRLLNFIYRT